MSYQTEAILAYGILIGTRDESWKLLNKLKTIGCQISSYGNAVSGEGGDILYITESFKSATDEYLCSILADELIIKDDWHIKLERACKLLQKHNCEFVEGMTPKWHLSAVYS